MGPGSEAGTTREFVVTASNNASALQKITGTIVLAGAGKMGGAMLTGWLAGGLNPKRVVVVEPHPSTEINVLAATGVRLNPPANVIDHPAAQHGKHQRQYQRAL